MITQSQYLDHLQKIRQIKHTRGNIKTISRLEKCHKEARKLRQINYDFHKNRKPYSLIYTFKQAFYLF